MPSHPPAGTPADRPSSDDVRTAVALATTAPSVHNSQPWHFRWDGARLDVLEERERSLPVLDPSGRERVVSIGGAVLLARLGFAELGWDVDVTLLPDDATHADVLARLTVTGRRAPTEEEHELAQAAPRRVTDRNPYDERPIPDDVLTALRRAAEAEGAWLRVLDADELIELQVLLAHADEAQVRDPAYREELASWRRDLGPLGVPERALPTVAPEDRAANLALRDFNAGSSSAPRQPARAGSPEHPVVVALGTSGDTRHDWLVAGQALVRVLVRGTVSNLAAQPLTAVLEVPAFRARLGEALGGVGAVQMVLRLGYGTRGPATHRLPVEDVLEFAGAT